MSFGSRGYSPGFFDFTLITASTTTRNNSEVLLEIPDLTIQAPAGSTWLGVGFVFFDSSAVADIDLSVVSSSATRGAWGSGANLNQALGARFSRSGLGAVAGAGVTYFVEQNAAGTIQVQFAQDTAEVSDAIIQIGSYMQYHRIS